MFIDGFNTTGTENYGGETATKGGLVFVSGTLDKLIRAFDSDTYKLKFGHRGGNQPVKDIANDRVYITAQNHGYAVSSEIINPNIEITHINLNDNTVSGIKHKKLPIMGIQYHSEASPGPQDNEYLFDEFINMMSVKRKNI